MNVCVHILYLRLHSPIVYVITIYGYVYVVGVVWLANRLCHCYS